MKGSIYEGGLRVPSIVEWPAKKLKGHIAMPASTCDFYPTLLAMAGIKHEAAHVLDGIDLSSVMTGGAGPRGRSIGFWSGFGNGDLCHSDTELKALMEKQQAGEPLPEDTQCLRITSNQQTPVPEDTATGHAAWNDWPWKLHRINGTGYELYHLENDPMETNNLAQQPEHKERVQRMQKELDAWMRSVMRSHNGMDYAKDR
jgi:arylsulfatase A-like enzyme